MAKNKERKRKPKKVKHDPYSFDYGFNVRGVKKPRRGRGGKFGS